jgi:hypothetical protein
MQDFRTVRFSSLAGSAMTVTRGSDTHQSGSPSFDGPQHNERLHVRFRAWRRAFVLCGALTGILVAALIGLVILRGTASSAPSPVTHPKGLPTSPAFGAPTSPAFGKSASPSSGTATSSAAVATSSSQTAQTLAVAGLIIGCVSAIGTLLSGWGTLVTARAMARQDMASHAPRARAKSTRRRTRKRK